MISLVLFFRKPGVTRYVLETYILEIEIFVDINLILTTNENVLYLLHLDILYSLFGYNKFRVKFIGRFSNLWGCVISAFEPKKCVILVIKLYLSDSQNSIASGPVGHPFFSVTARRCRPLSEQGHARGVMCHKKDPHTSVWWRTPGRLVVSLRTDV
jgi:hypothetical protein